jgi:hypothetical protein
VLFDPFLRPHDAVSKETRSNKSRRFTQESQFPVERIIQLTGLCQLDTPKQQASQQSRRDVMTKHVAEIVTFKLADGIKTENFVALMQKTEAFVRAQDGFLHRQLSQGEDGSWTDYVIWRDLATAQKVAQAFMQQDFTPDVMAAIAPETANMRHEEVQWSMAA